jgi:hypothetical protein
MPEYDYNGYYENNFLRDLNSSSNVELLKNRVEKIKIFGSNEKDTPWRGIFGYNDNLYSADYIKGDGTVIEGSACFEPSISCDVGKKGEHAKLIGNYVSEIVNFLREGRENLLTSSVSKAENNAQPTSNLSFSILNSSFLIVKTPISKRDGADSVNGVYFNESSNAKILKNSSIMEVSYENPLKGTYEIEIKDTKKTTHSCTKRYKEILFNTKREW